MQVSISEGVLPVRAVVFDLDGVIRAWDTAAEEAIEAAHGLVAGAIMEEVMVNARTNDVITGVIDDAQFRDVIANNLAQEYGESARVAVAEWSRQLGTVNQDVLAYVAELRRDYVVALLSNATSRLAEDLRTLAIDNCFDHVFNTSEIGVAKPNPEVYAHVARQLELTTSEWLFVDDILDNVRGAESLGIRAHHYRDLATLRGWVGTQLATDET